MNSSSLRSGAAHTHRCSGNHYGECTVGTPAAGGCTDDGFSRSLAAVNNLVFQDFIVIRQIEVPELLHEVVPGIPKCPVVAVPLQRLVGEDFRQHGEHRIRWNSKMLLEFFSPLLKRRAVGLSIEVDTALPHQVQGFPTGVARVCLARLDRVATQCRCW